MAFAFAAGLVVIAAMVPLNAALAERIGAATRELMGHKDDRVQRCSEMLHGIRVSERSAGGRVYDMLRMGGIPRDIVCGSLRETLRVPRRCGHRITKLGSSLVQE